ncbi:MAG: ATP-dependent sacrificial sulfur transferase LarE [Thermoplasmata archaeon]
MNVKIETLKNKMRERKKILVAFSGGVDSAVVAKLAYDSLGKNALAVTIDAETFPKSELEIAKRVAREIRIKHRTIKHSELSNPNIAKNPIDRCYHCRKDLALTLKKIAKLEGIETIADGVNFSDLNEHRPGIMAANEAGIWHPLIEMKLSKKDVRKMAGLLNLTVCDKPSTACLSSRIPYGERITISKLRNIEKAESFLRKLGFSQVRVRAHKNIARIEVPKNEINLFFDVKKRNKIASELKKLGYTYITLDLEGYRSGSMDEVLSDGVSIKNRIFLNTQKQKTRRRKSL